MIRTTRRAAFILQSLRSASPIRRSYTTLPNCNRANSRPSTLAADAAHVCCNRNAAHVRHVSPDRAKPDAGTAAAASVFADRAPEGDKQMGLGRTSHYPALWIERPHAAISPRMIRNCAHCPDFRTPRVSL
jgi:hypothetical protein